MRRKNNPEPVVHSYASWENDLGFLNLIISRKINIVKNFLINIENSRRKTEDLLSDKDIEPLISDCLKDILKNISGKYKTFIIDKYFGSEISLINFISEQCYVELLTDTINRNMEKIKQSLLEKNINSMYKNTDDEKQAK